MRRDVHSLDDPQDRQLSAHRSSPSDLDRCATPARPGMDDREDAHRILTDVETAVSCLIVRTVPLGLRRHEGGLGDPHVDDC